MSLLMDVINKLALEIGPRPPGSSEEKEAAYYLNTLFHKRGLNSEVVSFRSMRTFSLTFTIFYLMGILSVAFYPWKPWVALVLGALNALLFLAEINSWRIFGSLLDAWRSRNVIARKPARKTGNRSIILSAHMDSSRSGILFEPPVVYMFRPIFMGGLISLLLIPLLIAAAMVSGLNYFWIAAVLPALFLLSGIVLLMQREIGGSYTAGANDNASAVAVMVALADKYADQPLQYCDLWFVGTGSEESGVIGMINFVKSNRSRLKDPLFINLESLGCGQLYYMEREGMFPSLKADPYLAGLARETAEEKKLPFEAGRFHTILTDNVAVLSRKLPGLTLMGCGPRRLIPHWHRHSDLPENIDEQNLRQALELASGLIEKIDYAESVKVEGAGDSTQGANAGKAENN